MMCFLLQIVLAIAPCSFAGNGDVHRLLIRDVATVEGVRDNSLIGYGLVVGLKGTGDRQQTYFTVQTLASILARMGVQIPTASVARQQRGSRLRNRKPSAVFTSRDASGRDGVVKRRRPQPGRRLTSAHSSLRGRWPSLCGSPRSSGCGRIFLG